MVKVSIIMPMLNSIKYLKECMDSIINQTLKDIEIIVVDGGSTDGTVECIREYMKTDKRIRLIMSDKKSMGRQYNLGISMATGEYVGFCESDDYMSLDTYEVLYKTAKEYDLEYVKGDYVEFITVDEDKIFLEQKSGLKELYDIIITPRIHQNLFGIDGFMWNGIYNIDFIKEKNILLNETYGAAYQDSGFIQQVHMNATKAMHISHNCYFYRKDNPGASVKSSNTLRFVIDEYLYIMQIIKRNEKLYETVKAHMLYRYFMMFSMECKKQGKYIDINLVDEFRTHILKDYNELSDNKKIEIWGSDLMGWTIFKNSSKGYVDFIADIVSCRKLLFQEILGKVQGQEQIVIWGSGDLGSFICYLLKGSGVKNIVAITDNDSDNWGKELCNIKVVEPNSIFQLYQNAYHIITPVNYRFEIMEQLITAGISEERILKLIGIGRIDRVYILYNQM